MVFFLPLLRYRGEVSSVSSLGQVKSRGSGCRWRKSQTGRKAWPRSTTGSWPSASQAHCPGAWHNVPASSRQDRQPGNDISLSRAGPVSLRRISKTAWSTAHCVHGSRVPPPPGPTDQRSECVTLATRRNIPSKASGISRSPNPSVMPTSTRTHGLGSRPRQPASRHRTRLRCSASRNRAQANRNPTHRRMVRPTVRKDLVRGRTSASGRWPAFACGKPPSGPNRLWRVVAHPPQVRLSPRGPSGTSGRLFAFDADRVSGLAVHGVVAHPQCRLVHPQRHDERDHLEDDEGDDDVVDDDEQRTVDLQQKLVPRLP